MEHKRIKGVIAPNITFFTDNNDLDEKKCSEHMNWILRKGVNGLFVTGTYGSGYLMSEKERVRMFEIAADAVKSYEGAFVIAHVGCPDTAASVRLTREAARVGADAVSAIEPYQYKYTEEERVEFYKALTAAGELPVYAYNNPDVTGRPVTVKLLRRLREAGVAGLKDSAVNMQLLSAVCNDNELDKTEFQYISGTTTGWLCCSRLGVDAMIAGMCNYAPEIPAALYRCALKQPEKARRIYRICTELAERVKLGNSQASAHLNLQARGFDAGFMRSPLTVDYDKNQAAIKEYGRLIEDAVGEVEQLESIKEKKC